MKTTTKVIAMSLASDIQSVFVSIYKPNQSWYSYDKIKKVICLNLGYFLVLKHVTSCENTKTPN